MSLCRMSRAYSQESTGVMNPHPRMHVEYISMYLATTYENSRLAPLKRITRCARISCSVSKVAFVGVTTPTMPGWDLAAPLTTPMCRDWIRHCPPWKSGWRPTTARQRVPCKRPEEDNKRTNATSCQHRAEISLSL